MNGILLVDKPAGWTSHDVVAKLRALLRQELRQELRIENNGLRNSHNSYPIIHNSPKVKVGHTGTLDPAATGLLILVLGAYTKRAGKFSKLDKVYEAEITLGSTSTTGDAEGEINQLPSTNYQLPSQSDVEAVLGRFEGEILQRPHKYSAVKIDGQRAYKAARAGKSVEIEPRKVKVYELRIMNYEYPKLKVTAKVSSGTYIRSLAEDIGTALGTGAYLSALRRTEISDYTVKDALDIDNIKYNDIVNSLRQTSQ